VSDGRRYVIVSPVRNEADYIGDTLASVCEQTEKPAVWVVVDDGSTDGTAELVERYAREYPFVSLLCLGERTYGKGGDRLTWGTDAVVFNIGLESLDDLDYDYIVKLDGDLRFAPDYFERLFEEFEADSLLGIAGGRTVEEHGGKLVMDRVPVWHVHGATKVWRRRCFDDVGGVENILSWDTVDIARAHLKGWNTRSYDDPFVMHLRPQGGSGGVFRGRMRLGTGSYLMHYHPLFVAARSVYLGFKRPYLVGAVGYLTGYLQAVALRLDRLDDPAVRAYIRRSQLDRLIGREPRGVRT